MDFIKNLKPILICDIVDYLIRLLDKKAKSNLIYDYRNLLKNTNIIKKY